MSERRMPDRTGQTPCFFDSKSVAPSLDSPANEEPLVARRGDIVVTPDRGGCFPARQGTRLAAAEDVAVRGRRPELEKLRHVQFVSGQEPPRRCARRFLQTERRTRLADRLSAGQEGHPGTDRQCFHGTVEEIAPGRPPDRLLRGAR